jgi:DNA-binding CsgD family transcriptional regulator/tetratricopeptide (TPR) repeat protein
MTLWEQSLTLARETGDPDRVGTTLANLGYVAVLLDDNERATALCEEALRFAHELGRGGEYIAPEALVNLGLAALGQCDRARAMDSFEQALVASQKAGKNPTIINVLEGTASLAGATGEATRAAHLWGAAQAAREATGITSLPSDWTLHEPHLIAARYRLGEAGWEETLAEGRAMSLEQAAEYAVSRDENPSVSAFPASEEHRVDQPPADLTPREREIAALVAEELTNRQIASELVLSEHTVATHVRNVLKKLGLYSRNQIAARFPEHQPRA